METKNNSEFIYTLDKAWTEDYDEVTITPNQSVETIQIREGIFMFKLRNNPTQYFSQYGWAFVVKTQHSTEILQKIEAEKKKIAKSENVILNLYKEIDTL